MLQDRFTLGCSGWLDDDGGERIVYKFSYKTKPDGIHHLLQYTTKNLISNVLLPMGNSVWNYKLQVTVEITDRDGGTSKFPLSVEVSFSGSLWRGYRAFSRDITMAMLVCFNDRILITNVINLLLFGAPTWPPCSLSFVSLGIE